MKLIFAILLLLLTVLSSKAQNLVPNGSFENFSACPSASGQLTLAVNWINPSSGSPDYFNVCSSSMGVPYSGFGFQYPKTGNSDVGIWAFCNTTNDIREYIQCQLTNSLTLSEFYLVEYFVNRSNWSDYACNNVAGLLSINSTFTSGVNGLINANPQISKFNNEIIADTLNWVKISTVYQALGGEKYLTIGNFKNDALTTFSNIPGAPINFCAAYYFIDDVSVENITTPQWQYRDTTVVIGDSVLIGPAISGLNVDWFDMSSNFIKNAPGIYVKPTVNTSYQATETFNSAVYNHTVNVTVLPPLKVDEYDKLQNSVRLYPNPNDGNCSLRFDGLTDGNVEVSVSDITGKVVFKNTLSVVNALTLFNLDVKNGVYFVKITNNDKTIIKKLVVQQ